MTALLHAAAGRNQQEPALVRLIGELTTGNPAFSTLWAQHDVLRYRVCPKRFHHPEVGDVTFTAESFDLTRHPGLTMMVYTAEPASPSEQSLRLLGSWTAPEFHRISRAPGTA